MRKTLLLAIAILVLINGVHSQTHVYGLVIDQLTGIAVENVNVRIKNSDQGSTTDTSGSFDFLIDKNGKYKLVLSHIGYLVESRDLIIDGQAEVSIKVFLKPTAIELKQTVITATRTARSISELPVRTNKVTRAEISGYPANSTDDLLRSVAGLVINRSWGIFSKNTSVTMRGLEGSSRTLILLDGVPINKTAGGSVTWEMIRPEQIEEIEVVKGPNSALYGNNAMAGVINIKTKKPVNKISGYVSGQAGGYNVFGGSAGFSGNLRKDKKGLYYMFDGSYRQGDGYILEPPEIRDTNSSEAYLKDYNTRAFAGYQFNKNHKIELEQLHYYGKHGSGKKIFEEDGSFDLYRVNLTNLRYQGVSGNIMISSKIFFQLENYDNQKESINNTGVYKLSETFSEKQDYGIWTGFTYPIFKNHDLTTGFDFKHGQMNSELVYRTSPDVLKNYGQLNFFGIFIQDEFSILKNKLNVIAGLRFDWARFYDGGLTAQDPTSATGFIKSIEDDFSDHSWNNISPKLAVMYNFSDNLNTFVSVSSGFMPPKLDDLTRSGKITKGFKLANPNLKPETITSYEWGWNYEPVNKLRLESSFYLSYGHDFQYFLSTGDSVNTGGNNLKPVLQRQNISEIEVLGVELTGVWQLLTQLKVIATYAYNHSTIKAFRADKEFNTDLAGKYLIEVPRNQASISIFWKNKIMNTTLVYTYMGSQWYNDENTKKIDSYSLIDLEISKTLFNMFTISIIIQDLLDEQFVDRKGQLSPGRFVLGELKFKI